ncbi:uncharacterized protein LOC119326208 [Triticum dicoccoides]|uniref:uncharacterized protein LOC119326208 n=1 Tax=Triticum dicoccoides TaxID=85692 RepID=UPI000E7CE9E4|nr:uncharacterized protein LOC119326208 [Triticum dicoccoides]
MGLPFSALNKLGVPGLGAVTTGQVYDRHFKNKDTRTFEEFHLAYVEFCKYFNTVLPGQDFDTPDLEDIRTFHKKWAAADEPGRKKMFTEYMQENVHEAKVDDSLFIMAGLAAPAAAIIAKKSGESIPQVKKFKVHLIPNVVFVPLCTLVAIMGATAVQMSKKSKDNNKPTS